MRLNMPCRGLARYCAAVVLVAVFSNVASGRDRYVDPLLAIDQNRYVVIDRIVSQFHPTVASREAAVREALMRLRADDLLAAALAPSLDGLLGVLRSADERRSGASKVDVAHKALGNPTADLVYTPVVPCRIVDTRYGAGGPLAPGDTRNWRAANPAGSFSSQGGSGSDCAIPGDVAAVMTVITVANTGAGASFLTAWTFQQPRPNAAVLNWTTPGAQVGNGAIVPLCISACSAHFSLYASNSADVIIDVMGYFSPAEEGFVANRVVNGGPAFTGVTNVLGGSASNAVTNNAVGATIAGGGCSGGANCTNPGINFGNEVAADFGTIGGGHGNFVGFGGFSTVGGGSFNRATDSYATVGGGSGNRAGWSGATVGGGFNNGATYFNATVPGGAGNHATGFGSFAAGLEARTYPAGNPANRHDGVFIWADFQGISTRPFHSSAMNEFAARATGGVRFVTSVDGSGNPTWTCGVGGGSGNSWACTSDRDLKQLHEVMDGTEVLNRLAAIPVYLWSASDDPRNTRHAGPTAQDFMAAFGLGSNDRMIGFADAQGVAIAAIQGLHRHLRHKQLVLETQAVEIADLRRQVDEIRAMLRR